MNIKKTIIAASVALTLVAMVAPSFAGATTTADIIAQLQAQIAQLTAQLSALAGGTTTTTTTTGSVPAQCVGVTFTQTMNVGSTGSQVSCLQAVLTASGISQSVTGTFGPRTLANVKIFQTQKGITPTGNVGPLTRAALNGWLAGGTTTTPPGQQPVVTTGPVSAVLDTSSPASGAIVGGQATADMLHINFTGTGTVTSVTLRRNGLSDQNLFTSVYLYDGATRLTDGYTFSVNGQIVINGLSIAVNGSHVISVRGDVTASASATQGSAAIGLASFTANGSAVSSSVVGNMMAVVSGSLANAYISASATPSSDQTPSAGSSSFAAWSDTLNIVTRAVQLKGANFKIVGSVPSDALSNIRLFIDGVDAGTVATVGTIQGSSYAMFVLGTPATLTTGAHTVDVRADIFTGASRTFTVSLQQAADLTVYDPQVGVNIALTANAAGTTAFSPKAANQQTIQTGTSSIVIDSTFNSLTNVTAGATNIILGKFIVHGYGEDVKVNDLYVTPIIASSISGETPTGDPTLATGSCSRGTDCSLANVTVYFNGVQVGTQKNWTGATVSTPLDYTMGSQMIIPAGVDSILEIRADMQTTGGVNYTAGVITAVVEGQTSSNALGQTSQSSVKFPDTSDVYKSGGLTISSASLQVSKNTALANYTAAPNTSNVKIGSFTLQNQSTSEAVRLTTLTVTLDSDISGTDLSVTELTGISALRTSDTTGSGSTPIVPTASNTFSVGDVLQPSASMTIDIYANIGSGTLITAVATQLKVASIGVSSNVSSAGSFKVGQFVTVGTGTIGSPTKVTSGSTASQYVLGGATAASRTTFNFISTSGASTISELRFVVTGSDANPTQTVTNVCVGTVCGQPINNSVKLTNLSLVVPDGANGLSVPVIISYAKVGTGGVTPEKTSLVSLSYVKYTSGGTTKIRGTAAEGTYTDLLAANVDGNTMTLVGGKPAVVVAAGGNSGMVVNSSTKVGQATITATSGAIKVRTIVFNVTWSGYGTLPTTTTAQSLTDSSGNTLTDFTCTSSAVSGGAATVTCITGATYATDFPIGMDGSQEFDLYVTTGGGVYSTTGGTAVAASSLAKATFLWDDTSDNGSNGLGLPGTLVNGFPINSYTVRQ